MNVIWIVPVIVGAILVAHVFKALFRSPVGDAWAEVIRTSARRRRHWKGMGGEWSDVPGDAGVGDERRLEELEARLAAMDTQLTELAERVDFAERLLAERRKEQLSAGR